MMRENPTPLDFNEDPPANIYEAVSRVLRHFGDQGATMEDLAGMFQKNCPQWKPQSVSPTLTYLIRVGCAREERNFGTRRVYHLKPATDLEFEEIRVITRNARDEAARKRLEASAPPAPNGAHVLGKDASAAVQGGKIMVAVGKNNTVILTGPEARELYETLKAIFG